MIKRTTIIEIITVLNIILFLYTAIAKIMDYSVFKEQLTVSPILAWAAKPIALLLPWLEFIVVVLLIIPRWRIKGLYSSLILMTVFTVYIITMYIVASHMPCSCGGIMEQLSWKAHLVFNGVFVLINACAIYLCKKEKKDFNKDWGTGSEYSISHI